MAREFIEGERGLVDGVESVFTPEGIWEPIKERLPGGGTPQDIDIERDSNFVDLDKDTLDFIKKKGLTAPFATSTDTREEIIASLQRVAGGGLVTRRAGEDLTLKEIEERATLKATADIQKTAATQKAIQVEMQEAEMIRLTAPFDEMLGAARRQKDLDLSRANAILTRAAGGLGMDTASQSVMSDIIQKADQRITTLTAARQRAVETKKLTQLAEVSLSIEREQKQINDMLKSINDYKIDIYNLQNEQAQQTRLAIQTEFNIVSKLKEGDSWTDMFGNVWEGIAETDPFFTSASIVSMMKEIPMGTTQTITAPDGTTMEVTGIMSLDANTKIYQSIDNAGNMHIVQVDENTGEVKELGVVRGVGKTKTIPAGEKPSRFKLSSDDRGRLLAVGLSDPDITALESDIREFGFETAAEGLTDEQKNVTSQILKGLTTLQAEEDEPFLDETFLFDLGLRRKKLREALESIELYRGAGYTDKEILKLMQ